MQFPFHSEIEISIRKNNMDHAYHIDLLGNSFCKMAMAICMSEKCTTKKLLDLSISLKKLVGHMGLTNLLGCDSSDTCVCCCRILNSGVHRMSLMHPRILQRWLHQYPAPAVQEVYHNSGRKEKMMAVVHAHFE
jgi:hypothetical protein